VSKDQVTTLPVIVTYAGSYWHHVGLFTQSSIHYARYYFSKTSTNTIFMKFGPDVQQLLQIPPLTFHSRGQEVALKTFVS